MKTFRKIMFVAAVALNTFTSQLQAQSQAGTREASVPQYYAVYESAYHETSKLGLHPTGSIQVDKIEVSEASIAVTFSNPEKGPAIINIYDAKGALLLNQYVELNGTEIQLPIYRSLPGGVQFLHVFTDKKEAIVQFKNNQTVSSRVTNN